MDYLGVGKNVQAHGHFACSYHLMISLKNNILSSYTTPANAISPSSLIPECPSSQHLPSVVVRHLQTSPLEPTLDVEPLVRLAAIQDGLVTPDLLSHEIQRLNDPRPQLLALLVLGHSNVLDVSNKPQLVDELALDDQRTGADDMLGGVEDGDQEV